MQNTTNIGTFALTKVTIVRKRLDISNKNEVQK